jgi:hypothetical protein
MQVSLPSIFKGSEFQRSSRYDLERGLTAAQSVAERINNSRIIISMFRSAGYPIGIGLAAVANARHESDISNYAIGDSGQSVGLFQLYDRGAGAGMTIEERMSPRANTQRIIQETKTYGGPLMEAYRNGASVAELSLIFGRDIERPANKGVGRDNTARSLFGTLADVPAKSLVFAAAAIPISIGLGLGALAIFIVALSTKRRRA